MISDLKPYPEMKDSGVAWLGALPAEWRVLPNRAIFGEVRERDCPDEQMLSVTITRGVIPQHALLTDSSKKDGSNQDKSAYKLVRPGDIVYNKMRAWQGAIGMSAYQGIVSPAYVVQRPSAETDARYLHYLLRTPAFAKEAERWSYGITSDMWSLRPEHFRMIYACVPSLPEQKSIVRFLGDLDRKTAHYILMKQRLLTVLEEQRRAVINQAVTRGLNPHVQYKQTGVEWIGDVPKHWDVKPLKYLSRQITVGIVVQPAALYVPSGVPCLRSLNISTGIIDPNNLVFISEESNEAQKKSQIFEGDVVVVRTGQAGVAAVVTKEFDGANCIDLLIIRKSSSLLSDYLLTNLNSWSARTDVRFKSVGAIQAHYNTSTLASLVIPAPPIVEQNDILGWLTLTLEPIDLAMRAARREIDLMLEYRVRLMADVVTGQFDVREMAAKLPEPNEAPEAAVVGLAGEGDDGMEVVDADQEEAS